MFALQCNYAANQSFKTESQDKMDATAGVDNRAAWASDWCKLQRHVWQQIGGSTLAQKPQLCCKSRSKAKPVPSRKESPTVLSKVIDPAA